MNKFLLFLFLVIFFKSLAWSFFVPLWHFPDEQEHFTHIACNAESKKLCGKESPKEGNLNKEIYNSLVILGVDRDEWGNNLFTYHPEYRIPYSSSLIGIYEEQIINQPLSARREFIKHDMAEYPEFFYELSKIIYNFFYQENLLVRVFLIRIFWFWCLFLIVYSAYRLGLLISPDSPKIAMSAAVLTAFQPMLTFVSAGITSDNLFNALFSLVILVSALILKDGLKIRFLLWLTILLFLGFLIKPQFYIVLGLILPVFVYHLFLLQKRKQKRKFLWLSLAGIVVLGLVNKSLINSFITKGLNYLIFQKDYYLKEVSLVDHWWWTLRHTFAEVLPWYWGNFRWLSLNLPRWVNRLLMRFLLLAILGFIYNFWLAFKKQKINIILIFLLYVGWLYFMVLFFWDWNFINHHGFSFGIQGRYYFPVIVSHMIFLVFGFEGLAKLIFSFLEKFGFKNSKGLVNFLFWLLNFGFIVLNLIAFFWLMFSYFDWQNLSVFITQASQYKPWFAKGVYLIFFLFAYLLSSLFFIFYLKRVFLKIKK